ncbi:MAG: hypothetical protein JKY33_05630 [Bacteroidia bacterium]|nr:hypothetical protein [Bacteroidia bacterium]
MKRVLGLILVGLIVVYFSSCTKDQADKVIVAECDTLNITYTNDIKSIIDANCTNSCHTSSNTNGISGANLEDYTNTKDEALNGTLLEAIKHETTLAMPLNGTKLADSVINKVYCWIENGAPE